MLFATRLRTVAALSAAAICSLPALAQDAGESFKGTVLIIDHAHLGKLFSAPKDKPVADALAMVPARLREVAREAPNMPPELPGLANMALHALTRPGRLVVSYNGENPSGGAYGYGIALSTLLPDQETGDQMHATISAMAAQSGQRIKTGPRTRFPGMSDLQTPMALVSFGPRQAAGGVRYEIIAGTMENPDAPAEALPAPADLGAPAGFEPAVRARLDLAGLDPAMQIVEGFAGQNPEAVQGMAQLRQLGIGGKDALKLSYVVGHTKEESLSIAVVEGAGAVADKLGFSRKPLTKANLDAIPADAVDAFMRNGEENWAAKLDQLANQNPQIKHGLDEFQSQTGVDPRDLLGSLGGTVAFYLSDSTGGGTIGSAVAMVSLKDKARFSAAFGKLIAVANLQADKAPMGPGYIRLAPWKDGEAELVSLRFPGLPVPLEVTFAMTQNWLILGPTPQAAIAAARQASGKGGPGLTASKAFAQAFPEGKSITAISFSDTPRNMAIGYPILSMLGSGVANMVRSPVDPARDPGMLVPLYSDLRSGARARVGYTYWRGEDMVSESHADRSLLVNAAGAAGLVTKILPVIAVPALLGAAQERNLGALPAGLPAPIAFFASEAASPYTPDHHAALAIATVLSHTTRQATP